eukprot:gb/GFBE01008526.1/.p1 GENE.gb/GFBE01008526.1/~~gb/GFBE01008526.1/.p1  ORF type:complete len:191 (+),score=26.06 gb/GFBE01008526.1/:1-573(+)
MARSSTMASAAMLAAFVAPATAFAPPAGQQLRASSATLHGQQGTSAAAAGQSPCPALSIGVGVAAAVAAAGAAGALRSRGSQGRVERRGRTSVRAISGALSTGPFVETEEYPAEAEMSAAVPYLRYPKQLKGWVGEEKGFDPLGVTDALPVYWVRDARHAGLDRNRPRHALPRREVPVHREHRGGPQQGS